MSEFEIIEGRRKGAVVYICMGFLYLKNNVYKDKVHLRCHSHSSGCSGTGYIQGGKLFEGQGHMHTEQNNLIEKLKTESKIKDDCEKTPLAPKDIYNDNLKTNCTGISPFSRMSSTMRKRRATTFPSIPKSMMGFHQILHNTDLGKIQEQLFYRTFATVSKEYALIFMAEINHSILEKVENVHIDATFKTVPNSFFQLLIVHGVILDTVVPCIFVLMTSKSRVLYDAVFLSIRILVPCLKPKTAVCDFETALFSSVKFNFGSELKGCLFYYRQAIWRKWQQLGLSVSKEISYPSWLKLIMSLPLLIKVKFPANTNAKRQKLWIA